MTIPALPSAIHARIGKPSPDYREPFTIAYQANLVDLHSLPDPAYPIYVPSKGRASTITTTKCLREAGVGFHVVVEPQDRDDYETVFGQSRVLVMPENDRGIAYVRNFCKAHAKENGHTYHWQIDDNIRFFAIRQNNRRQRCLTSDALKLVESTVNQFTGIGAAGMKHITFDWSADTDIGYNQQVYTCMLLSTEPEAKFRDGLIEDTDYNLQLLFAGYSVVMFNRVVMDKITTMEMKGGNTEISHANGGRERRAIATQRQWPNVFPRLKEGRDGRRLAPSRVWATFTQRPVPARPYCIRCGRPHAPGDCRRPAPTGSTLGP